jgi:hypothetical protein
MTRKFKANIDVTSRFLSIGFSANHDALFMGAVAEAGLDRGNFIYIDTDKDNYGEQVKNSLADSLDMAMEGSAGVKIGVRNSEQ